MTNIESRPKRKTQMSSSWSSCLLSQLVCKSSQCVIVCVFPLPQVPLPPTNILVSLWGLKCQHVKLNKMTTLISFNAPLALVSLRCVFGVCIASLGIRCGSASRICDVILVQSILWLKLKFYRIPLFYLLCFKFQLLLRFPTILE